MEAGSPHRRPESARGTYLDTPQKFAFCAEWSTATKRGSKSKVLKSWKVTRPTACRIFKDYSVKLKHPGPVSLSGVKKSGRPSSMQQQFKASIADVPIHKRTSVRTVAKATGITKTTLHRQMKREGVVRRARSIKPSLSDKHKLARMRFVIERMGGREPLIDDHYDIVRIDEKWFYLMRDRQKVYVAPWEEMPAPPKVQHKS
jgi:hypothetical protein